MHLGYRQLMTLAVSAVFALALGHNALAKPRLDRISFEEQSGGGIQMRLHLSRRPTAYSEPRLVADGLLEVRVINSWLSRDAALEDPKGIVSAYHTEQDGADLLISIALGEERFSVDFGRDTRSDDLLLTISRLDPPEGPALADTRVAPDEPASANERVAPDEPASANERVAPDEPASAEERVAPDKPASSEEPASADNLASTDERPIFSEPANSSPTPSASAAFADTQISADRWKVDTIVIDAGHGGKDTGAIGYGGLREKDVVLSVALMVGNYLKRNLGVNVIYTRDDDRFIELHERGSIANQAGAKLFVSIHANSARSSQAHGTETFFLGMHRTASAQSVMERENSVISLEDDQTYYEKYDQAGMVRMQLAQSVFMRKSEHLAALVQDQFEGRVQRRNRGVKQAGFVVLYEASMPSILVELGFVTNRQEASFLRSRKGQDYLASAIFRAIRDYKDAMEAELDVVSATARDD